MTYKKSNSRSASFDIPLFLQSESLYRETCPEDEFVETCIGSADAYLDRYSEDDM